MDKVVMRTFRVIVIDQVTGKEIINCEADRMELNHKRDIRMEYGFSFAPQYAQQKGPTSLTLRFETDDHHQFNEDERNAYYKGEI